MIPARFSFICYCLMIVFLNQRSMAQTTIVINDDSAVQNSIQIKDEAAKYSAGILKKYLDKSFSENYIVKSCSCCNLHPCL